MVNDRVPPRAESLEKSIDKCEGQIFAEDHFFMNPTCRNQHPWGLFPVCALLYRPKVEVLKTQWRASFRKVSLRSVGWPEAYLLCQWRCLRSQAG